MLFDDLEFLEKLTYVGSKVSVNIRCKSTGEACYIVVENENPGVYTIKYTGTVEIIVDKIPLFELALHLQNYEQILPGEPYYDGGHDAVRRAAVE